MITRRMFTGALAGASLAGVVAASFGEWAMAADSNGAGLADKISKRLARIEASTSGRLGVSVLDTGSGAHAGLRADEAFPMCSTFKFLAAGFVLARVDKGEEDLKRKIVYSKSDLVDYSPVTQHHADSAGLSVAALCDAAITLSDNTAANLLLASFGGPAALTAFVRTLGDTQTRLDRNEPTLNESTPGDPRDTTTPNAMLANMRTLLLTDRLSVSSCAQLRDWLIANKTGAKRIREKLPKDWRVGDKTGTGSHGSTNDIAIIWPPKRAPLLVTAYLTQTSAQTARREAAIADIGGLVVSSF
ncbi:class A beta-lactamase [Burkholderia sp. PAMC 28687]|uniref:class A beta-lactamase n=1 Tax=Burkholderia sp. PAMC 28687 TaxID=1795874 RepID=UPI000784351A|nr:class A beta-lactamase [Burkholderia sp. PAMC 28687]AMM17058.1 class A beta-lactamase [Burkholderia sp. PAMC 28687]